MRTIFTVILFGVLFGKSAFAICVFGDHLVQTARMNDLEFSEEKIITSDLKSATPEEINHLKIGMKVQNISEVMEEHYEARIWVRTIIDTAHERNYSMYLYSSGDNIVGFFIDNRTNNIIAEVGDGSIYNCKAFVEEYDHLRWFYTN